MNGTLSILSVGEGDTTLSFDKSNPAECERAKRIIQDMLKRGFSILIKIREEDGEPIYKRAKDFDPETCEYIIAGDTLIDSDQPEAIAEAPASESSAPMKNHHPLKIDRRRGPRNVRIKAEKAEAVAVGRVAGG